MDDYERLNEWMAYHHFTLPLKHLVMFRDPNSSKDPLPILNRYRDLMRITYWTNVSQFPHTPDVEGLLTDKVKDRPTLFHRRQQTLFYRNCLTHLQQSGCTWTFVGDTDEFLILNKKNVPDQKNRMKERGSVMKLMKLARRNSTDILKTDKQRERWGGSVCITVPRHQFSSYESPKEAVFKDVPPFLDAYGFQTMRFRHHDSPRQGLIGKSVIDVSKVSLTAEVKSAHSLFGVSECGYAYGKNEDLLQVNHYLGTWEMFYRPNDRRDHLDRRQYFFDLNEVVKKRARSDEAEDIRPWLQGFVEYFGQEKSLVLLAGIGGQNPYNETTALPILY